jgi:hypothetical protein
MANYEATNLGRRLLAHIRSGRVLQKYVPTKLAATIVWLGDPADGGPVGAGVLSLGWAGMQGARVDGALDGPGLLGEGDVLCAVYWAAESWA